RSHDCHRTLTLRLGAGEEPQVETYHLSRDRWLGAQKFYPKAGAPSIRFAVWAPNARNVEVMFAGPSGYIADDGHGIDAALGALSLTPCGGGVWEATLAGHESCVGRCYMYRITRDNGSVVYRTDMYSREQV